MIRVKNNKAIRNLSVKSLKADKVRNVIAVFAVALTSMLFMALFTVADTIVSSFQQQTFREVGSDAHASFKNLTLEAKRELEQDPLIEKSGSRLMLGVAVGDEFRKVQAELSYMDAVCAESYFCVPEYGGIPKEGTKEIACDTRILQCLGVEPEIGAEVTVAYEIGGIEKTQIAETFSLCGWWEYDPAAMASMAIVPESYINAVTAKYPRAQDDDTDYTGLWTLGVYLNSSMHIEEEVGRILDSHGYQTDDPKADNYIHTGVNWAYAGAQLNANADAGMVAGIAAMLALIVFSGYLIIYNIFRISVTSDIRFYGLLKTIGTTGRQIKRIIRRQVFLLSAAGIPIGILLGCLLGFLLAPVVLAEYKVGKAYLAVKLWYFLAAAVFSFVTVFLSCAIPGRIAAKVSPVEAVRYTDVDKANKMHAKRHRRSRGNGRPFFMAKANLGRNLKKTALVILSLMLAVVLMELTYMFAMGFDMDKYLRSYIVSDFILGDAAYFRGTSFEQLPAVAEEDIANMQKGGEITQDGRVYGHVGDVMAYAEEDVCRAYYGKWMEDNEIDGILEMQEKDAQGRFPMDIMVYGMEGYPLSELEVIDGDLKDLYNPDKHAVAAVYLGDDYASVMEGSQYAKTGDTIDIRYVYEWEYVDSKTGKPIPEDKIDIYPGPYEQRQKKYQDISYEVVACVMVKYPMSYRYSSGYEFVLNADVFQRDSHTSDTMAYLFNTTQESNAKMQKYLENYTEEGNPLLDFESKEKFAKEFYEFRNMYLIVGGALSAIVGMIGILNFFNVILTSVYARRREFAMLQSIGMTGRQLKQTLICEGLLYAGSAAVLSLAFSVVLGPVMGDAAGSVFWFFTYRFTVVPVLLAIPIFALLGIALPLASYRRMSRQPIVERLQESE